ncbi:MAG: hypothetical protein IJS14_08155 [Lentisphaeria bacterium]|nr:hypothetical protein [Lentisphaeria bacterium]
MDNTKIETISNALPEDIFPVRYDLEKGDVMLSARLVDAAAHGRWPEVTRLLSDGADPRICRHSDGVTCESALYFAIKAKEFDIAHALFEAGDRLDDLRASEFDTLPAESVNFLARASAYGDNFFVEDGKPISECIRCGLWAQTREALDHASRKELNLSVEMIGLHFRAWNAPEYLALLDELRAHGANTELIARTRQEMRQWVLSLPSPLRAQITDRVPEFLSGEDS